MQGEIEAALRTVFSRAVRVSASGRTDAGVHALGQVASFDVDDGTDLDRLRASLNALSGRGISVVSLEPVNDGFDPRRDACARSYRYWILNRRAPSPFLADRAWHIVAPLDWTAMAACAELLAGEHDFSAFRAADCEAAHARRRVMQSRWLDYGGGGDPDAGLLDAAAAGRDAALLGAAVAHPDGEALGSMDGSATESPAGGRLAVPGHEPRVKASNAPVAGVGGASPHAGVGASKGGAGGGLRCYEIRATAYLKQMVRIIVGTMAEVGLGRMSVQDFQKLLDSGGRADAGRTAPACGLTLFRVEYPGADDQAAR